MKLLTLFVLGLGAAGCARVEPTSPASVQVGVEMRPRCQKMGNIKCSAWSKGELSTELKSRAAELGANYVQVQSISQGHDGFEGRGLALLCR